MKSTYYIWNTKTDANYDTNEGKFYSSNWEPELEKKSYLEMLISNSPDTFENCVIVNKLD